MITRLDIEERSGEWGLSPEVVEKDYVLGWLLAAIGADPLLSQTLVFKGGTCLKKCYFETYRFSEDLDFTMLAGAPDDVARLVDAFGRVAEVVRRSSGVEIPVQDIKFEVFENRRGKTAAEGRLYYRGPLQPGGSLPRIKIDLTTDEVVVRPSILCRVSHSYPDRPDMGAQPTVRCYSYDEVFAEKLRALVERTRPRDLYDVVNVFWHEAERPAASQVLSLFREKCIYKGFQAPEPRQLLAGINRGGLEADWQQMLRHQLPTLPELDHYFAGLEEAGAWLAGATVVSLDPVPSAGTTAWAAPMTIDLWREGFPLELIRFAGRNHLCIDLGYQNTTRLVEPYSFRRSMEGALLFYAWKLSDGEIHSYRADRITRLQVSKQPFSPRFRVEF